jgi:NmrA-like family
MQGGGLARALAQDSHGPFKARAVTRSVTSDKAKALTALGVQSVTADLDDLEVRSKKARAM